MDDTLDLRDYLAVLRRRRWLVVLVTVVVVVTAVGVSMLQTPVYEASADVLVEPVRRSEDAALESILLGESAVETERRVMTSRPVTERVIEDLELDVEPDELVEQVSTSAQGDSMVIQLSATSTDAELATAIANSYATSYLEHVRSRAVERLTAAQTTLDRKADELRGEIADLEQQIAEANAAAADPETTAPPADVAALQAELTQRQAELARVESSTIDASQPSELVQGGGEVLVPAEVPQSPVSPKPIRTGVLGLVLGLMLGVGLAFLRDHLDDGIRDDDDVRRIADGAPLLGRIAHWEDKRADERLMTLIDPHDLVSEEFRGLSANVRFSLISRGRHGAAPGESTFRQQSVLITSADPGEGKSSVAGNLAVAASLAGLRVILVDADMRQPTLHERFGIPAGRGVSDLLVDADLDLGIDGALDDEQLAAHLADVGLTRLRILPAGTVPPNPTELLASPQMHALHDRLRAVADLVIYDSPPLLPVADTLELSSYVDAVMIVVRTEQCRRRDLQEAVERLEAVGAPLGGFVLNDVTNLRGQAYGYGYRYSYRSRQPEPDERRRRRDPAGAPTGSSATNGAPHAEDHGAPVGDATVDAERPAATEDGAPVEPARAPSWVSRRR